MASPKDNLAVETRSKAGSTASNSLRKAGKVPAVLFGHGVAALPVALDAKAFDELLHSGGKNSLLNITIDGKTKDTALLREVQRDPITRRILHADLQRVSATETVGASLTLVTIGVPDGVKNSGGVMDVIFHAIEVEGPANALPPNIEVDVSELALHQHVTAGDVKLPANFKLKMDPSTVLIAIEPSRTEQQAAEAAETAAAAVAPVAAEVPTVAETTAPPDTTQGSAS
jgi:large subunit ribosomal protein L25